MMISEIKLYKIFKVKFGEKEAESIVEGIKQEVKGELSAQKEILAAKEDINNSKTKHNKMKHSLSSIFQIKTLTAAIMLATLSLELGTWNCQAQSANKEQAVPYTLQDRDRAVRMEVQMNERFESMQKEMNTRFESMQTEMNTRFESMQKEMNIRFESQQQQMNDLKESIRDLKNLFYWGFGILFTFMVFILGYIIWDRKTVTEPIREHTQSLMQTLREYAKEQPKLADILRSHGLL